MNTTRFLALIVAGALVPGLALAQTVGTPPPLTDTERLDRFVSDSVVGDRDIDSNLQAQLDIISAYVREVEGRGVRVGSVPGENEGDERVIRRIPLGRALPTDFQGIGLELENTRIDQNADGVTANAAGVERNEGRITETTAAVTSNTVGVATNAAGVEGNATSIETNTSSIASNRTDIDLNTAGVARNAASIRDFKNESENRDAAILAIPQLHINDGHTFGFGLGGGFAGDSQAIGASIGFQFETENAHWVFSGGAGSQTDFDDPVGRVQATMSF